ncbi:MAG: HAMP domain-containing sensor histidine kinase [Cyanobacteria bacterium P01_H01_bin.15]
MPQSNKGFWELPSIDFQSLRVRLTVGVVLLSALGIFASALGTGILTQRILIKSQKQNLEYLARRFPRDVEVYAKITTLPASIQQIINEFSSDSLLLWVENPDGTLYAQSMLMQPGMEGEYLMALTDVPPFPEVRFVRDRFWLLCRTPLTVHSMQVGDFYVARDITESQQMLLTLMRWIALTTVVVMAFVIWATSAYIQRSLLPLKRLGRLTETVSVDDLGAARLTLEQSPREVDDLVGLLNEMLQRLSQAWEEQRQLVSNVSHELRTPLTIVSGYLQSTLRRGDNLTPLQREGLETAASEAERTIQLMQDLLDLARAESGNMHLQLEILSVQPVIKEVVTMARDYSDRKIELELPASEILVNVDRNRLKQVLLNLIDNAVKYSPEPELIQVTLTTHATDVAIAVRDHGMGIPLTLQSRIFERFFRVDEARSRSGGTGLGLAIVKTIVESMGGRIAVRSQPGKGSTFTVWFPVAPVQ